MKKKTITSAKTITFRWVKNKRTSVRLSGDEIDALAYLYNFNPNGFLAKRILPLAVQDMVRHVTYKKKKNLTQILRNLILREFLTRYGSKHRTGEDSNTYDIKTYRELYEKFCIQKKRENICEFIEKYRRKI